MRKLFLLSILCGLGTLTVYGQSFWKSQKQDPILKSSLEREIIPDAYLNYKLDLTSLKQHLKSVASESDYMRSATSHNVELPMPNGVLETFEVFESSVMEPGISARYPSIRSYKAISKANPTVVGRFDIGHLGFHGAIQGLEGQIYIDPYAAGDIENYIVYYTKDYHPEMDADIPLCGSTGDLLAGEHDHSLHAIKGKHSTKTVGGEPVPLRTYRMAIAGSNSWANRPQRRTLERCLSDINTSLNRLNLILENEASIRMLLVDDNDRIIFLDTDPYVNPGQGRELINENTTVLNSIIGANNYEIGHVYSICNDVGGIAGRPSLCTGRKGAGVTCFNGSNVNAVTVSIVAHEVGHQLSASHSFNQCDGQNESSGTAFEPGSGSTIMSYAGLCGSLNVQGNNDDYYHVGSLEEIYGYTRFNNTGDECSGTVETGNHAPEVSIPIEGGFFIPIGTPFELTGEASDPDGHPMTYNGEQKNTGPLASLGNPIGNAPSFRSLYPDTTKTRVFPSLTNLVNNIPTQTEVLPTTSRDFTFVFVARDQHPLGGTATWDEIKFKSTASAGPFVVSYPNLYEKFSYGDAIEVVWDVANTDQAPVSTEKVDILLSVDRGQTYPYVLAAGVDNDGAQDVILPAITTIQARIKVKATDNIFFDISNQNFEIAEPTEATFVISENTFNQDVCLPNNAIYTFTTQGFLDYSEVITFSVKEGLPGTIDAAFSAAEIQPGESTTLTLNTSNLAGTNRIDFVVEATGADGKVIERNLTLNTTGTDFEFTLDSPANGSSGLGLLPAFGWTEATDATAYLYELSLSPRFDDLVVSEVLSSTEKTSTATLDPSTVYYWRVKPFNSCNEASNEGYSEVFAFSTESFSCAQFAPEGLPLTISSSGTGSYELTYNLTGTGTADDINVRDIVGTHSRNGDLRARLVAPSGNEVVLWDRKCFNQQNLSLSLDDESAQFFVCPLGRGNTMRPENPLSTLDGEALSGSWKLLFDDTGGGNGGTITSANLEICSAVTLNPPELERNEPLNILKGAQVGIENNLLLTTDNNNTADQLIYTLVSTPIAGDLVVNGMPLTLGDQFSQMDIDASGLFYMQRQDNETISEDAFEFTVIDGEGGWVPITTFVINIDLNTTSVNDLVTEQQVLVFPNPTRDRFQVKIYESSWANAQLTLFDLHGRPLQKLRLEDGIASISTNQLSNGIYLVSLQQDDQSVVKRVSVMK